MPPVSVSNQRKADWWADVPFSDGMFWLPVALLGAFFFGLCFQPGGVLFP